MFGRKSRQPARTPTTFWPTVKKHLLYRTQYLKVKGSKAIAPIPICGLCDEELDIAGVPATTPDKVRFEAAALPRGHMFCIPCFNEYEDNLPDPSPYESVYNPICGRRKLSREYKCPSCRADMHHRECQCEVGAINLPSNDLLDCGAAEFVRQWRAEVLHPGEISQWDAKPLEGVEDVPSVMNEELRRRLMELVNAVSITVPELEASDATVSDIASDKNENHNSNGKRSRTDDEDQQHAVARFRRRFMKRMTHMIRPHSSNKNNNSHHQDNLRDRVIRPVCNNCYRACTKLDLDA